MFQPLSDHLLVIKIAEVKITINFSTVGSAVLNLRYAEERSVNLDEKIITNLFSVTCNEI